MTNKIAIHMHKELYIIGHFYLGLYEECGEHSMYSTGVSERGYLCGEHSMYSAGVSERGYLCGEHSMYSC